MVIGRQAAAVPAPYGAGRCRCRSLEKPPADTGLPREWNWVLEEQPGNYIKRRVVPYIANSGRNPTKVLVKDVTPAKQRNVSIADALGPTTAPARTFNR